MYPIGDEISMKRMRSEELLCEEERKKAFRIEVGPGMIGVDCAGLSLRVHDNQSSEEA